MMGIFLEIEYACWLEKEEEKRNPANKVGVEECLCCGFCCAKRTCVPRPEELGPIADYLKITTTELVRKYMVGDEMRGRMFWRFANTEQRDLVGCFLPGYRTFDKGDCVFYDRAAKECRIYPVRPRDARVTECWNEDNEEDSGIEHWTAGDYEEYA